MGNWRWHLWRNLLTQEKRLTDTNTIEISMGQRLLVTYVNMIPPFLCCSKNPISFEVAMHPAKRLHFVALLTARCGHGFNFLPKSVSRILCGLLERDWVLTFSTFLLPPACNADTIAEATWTIRHWHWESGVARCLLPTSLMMWCCHTSHGLPHLAFSYVRKKSMFINHLLFGFFLLHFDQISFQLIHHMKCLEPAPPPCSKGH